jgi:aspartate aminotransferase-like enzyme
MVKGCGAEPIVVATKGYDDIITAAMVEEAIDKHPDIAAITVVHCETPSGTLNPLEKIAKVCKKSDAILIVDAVSSIGGTEVKTDEWGIDINLCASQKCLSAPPGIGVLSLSEKAIGKISARENIPSFYSDLRVWINSWIKNRTMPFTHSISDLYAFRESLDMIMEEGIENMIARHKTISKAILKAVESIALELFPKKKEYVSPTVTALKVPKGIEGDKLIDRLWKKYGVMIAGAWGPILGGKVIRLGNMGFGANPRFTTIALSALEHGLKDFGYKIDLGTAVLTFEEAL